MGEAREIRKKLTSAYSQISGVLPATHRLIPMSFRGIKNRQTKSMPKQRSLASNHGSSILGEQPTLLDLLQNLILFDTHCAQQDRHKH